VISQFINQIVEGSSQIDQLCARMQQKYCDKNIDTRIAESYICATKHLNEIRDLIIRALLIIKIREVIGKSPLFVLQHRIPIQSYKVETCVK